jgi:hypothetical protein
MNNKDPYIEHLESTSNYLNDDEDSILQSNIDDSEFEDALSELDEDTNNE